MFNINITEAELAKIEYNDNAVKNMLTDKQRLAIELQKKQKVLEARKRFMNTKNSKPFERKIYLNHLPGNFSNKWVNIEDITEDMIEKEIEMGFSINW